MSEKDLQLRAEIKRLLKEAAALSQPSTFAQAAKLRRAAAAKEKELAKTQETLTMEMKTSFGLYERILMISKIVVFTVLTLWLWRVPVAAISKELVQPFVYKDETVICFLKKPESDDDSVLEISKTDYVENAFKNIYEDEEVVSVGEGRTVTQVKKKGKVTSERKEMVKNRTKGNVVLPVDTSDHIGCSSSVHKVKICWFLSWTATSSVNDNVMIGIIPWLILSNKVGRYFVKKVFKLA
ncbi:putative Get1 family protein [Helianthus anomalus]